MITRAQADRHFKEWQAFQRGIDFERARMKLPYLASLPTALDKHNHSLEARAEARHKDIAAQDVRAAAVDARMGRHLDSVDDVLKVNDAYLDDLEKAIGGNGAPTSGGASKPSPDQSGNVPVGSETTALGPVPRTPDAPG